MSFFSKFFSKKEKQEVLDNGLQTTKTSFFDKLSHAIAGKSKVDDDVLDELENVLVTSDVGVDTTLDIIHNIEERVARDKYVSTAELNNILREETMNLLVKSGNDVICLFDVRNLDVKYTLVPCAVVSSVDDIVEFSDLTYYN